MTCASYLGNDISSNLLWGSHIDRVVNSTNKTLRFVKRNIKTKMLHVRESAYNTLVKPQFVYAVAVSDPHNKDKIQQIQKVQQWTACLTTCNSDLRASILNMLRTSGWTSVEQRRADAQLCLFYKIVNNMVTVPFIDYQIH